MKNAETSLSVSLLRGCGQSYPAGSVCEDRLNPSHPFKQASRDLHFSHNSINTPVKPPLCVSLRRSHTHIQASQCTLLWKCRQIFVCRQTAEGRAPAETEMRRSRVTSGPPLVAFKDAGKFVYMANGYRASRTLGWAVDVIEVI